MHLCVCMDYKVVYFIHTHTHTHIYIYIYIYICMYMKKKKLINYITRWFNKKKELNLKMYLLKINRYKKSLNL